MQKFNKILLVDDDKAMNYLSREVLTELNASHEIAEAEDGLEAIRHITNSNCPDIVFLDIRMPFMDGFEFLDSLTQTDLCHDIKVVMLTSSIRPEDRKKAFTYKFVIDYFEKPLTEEKILKVKKMCS